MPADSTTRAEYEKRAEAEADRALLYVDAPWHVILSYRVIMFYAVFLMSAFALSRVGPLVAAEVSDAGRRYVDLGVPSALAAYIASFTYLLGAALGMALLWLAIYTGWQCALWLRRTRDELPVSMRWLRRVLQGPSIAKRWAMPAWLRPTAALVMVIIAMILTAWVAISSLQALFR